MSRSPQGRDPVNLEQVETGLAWHYKKYQWEQSSAERVKYADAERDARRLKLGLWRDPDPMPPWEYRQVSRERMKDLEPFAGKSTVKAVQ
jgi:endonuclease YncB( thermonuclease family)